MEWISSHKVQDLKHLLSEHTATEDGMAIPRERKKFTLHQGALYHCHTLAGELEEALQFVVPTAHRVAAMHGCYRDVGHQGQWQTLSLLQDWFWWPDMVMHMQKVTSGCETCIQHKGVQVKAPLQAILVTSPLELLHVDFTGIEMTMELDQPPCIVTVLVFSDHFMRHVMAYVTPDHTAKPVAKFLWQGYISIFGAPAKLLSDWGATFESNIISELCELMGIWKVWTSPYHIQTNGQVEWAHQMLMQMIEKLGKDWRADWSKHLPELAHAYKISCHQVQPALPDVWEMTTPAHWFLFSHYCDHRKTWVCWSLHCWLMWATAWSLQGSEVQSSSKAERQRQYYDHKANAISLESGDLVLAKADAYKGRRMVKDQWVEEPCKVECRIAEGIPSYVMKNQQTGCLQVLHWNQLLLITPVM